MTWKAFVAVVAALAAALFGLIVLGSGSDPADTNCLPTPGRGAPTAPGSVVFPMREGTYQVSSPYGPRDGDLHEGTDFAAPLGTP
ncbi:MAG: hypothetical protein ACRDTD_23520, partial [Pseudonocardiaceae bacterium]